MPILADALRIIFHQIEVGLPIFAPLRPPRIDEGTLMVGVKLIEVHHCSFPGWSHPMGDFPPDEFTSDQAFFRFTAQISPSWSDCVLYP